ncbi:formyltetrahydrofolate deformylase [Pigmentiphaga soli]|uniref:Formyltetrahydrofolate deformylase n=1 Tax=Pigmentiphaga soli TaxID=1007095 RepID=A0ABP8GBL9_9BURK
MQQNDHILTLACPDSIGIVYHVSGFLFERGCNIIDSQQFGDEDTKLFFLRVHFSLPDGVGPGRVREEFAAIGERFGMSWQIHDAHRKQRVMLMVSKHGHCLNDLLFRVKSGQLQIEIPAIVSNHPDFALLSASYGIPFYHLPVQSGGKEQQERQVLQIVERERIDLVVLARYMQILSAGMCHALAGRAINIHHSFLPSFKGARPYYQAHERGVKLIGATAHYVTPDLDEGPIIEQDIARVDHTMSPETLTQVGRDVESLVLSRAVRWHVEHRILINGHKTIVFR